MYSSQFFFFFFKSFGVLLGNYAPKLVKACAALLLPWLMRHFPHASKKTRFLSPVL